jgi:hypothetical protein
MPLNIFSLEDEARIWVEDLTPDNGITLKCGSFLSGFVSLMRHVFIRELKGPQLEDIM